MENNNRINADFCIEIDFDRHSENPSRVFQAMTDFIDAFQRIDKTLIASIDVNIEPILILEDIEASSLKCWLINRLKEQGDEALKKLNWKKIIGKYILRTKYFLLNFLEGKTTISNREEIKQLQDGLYKLAEETDVKKIPTYAQVPPKQLVENIGTLKKATLNLSDKDKAKYIAENKEVYFNKDFNFVPKELEDLITKEVLEAVCPMILKVKKPDYLGESKWEFIHDNRIIPVKINDEKWLKEFQGRKIDVRSGDSIRANIKVMTKYGYDFSVISTQYEIIKVLEIIKAENETSQLEM